MPLDGSAPTMLRVEGDPIDQMSFLEKDGYLNVLVAAEGKGLRMWAAEKKKGRIAFFRAPLSEFGGTGAWARPEEFRALPGGGEYSWGEQNRYVGDWLLYGNESDPEATFALRIDRKDEPVRLPLPHGVERIEAMGADALMVGNAKHDLHLTSVDLSGTPKVASQFVFPGASQSESRTHGFFYRPFTAREGIFGLPVVERGKASVQFLRNQKLRLGQAGELYALASSASDRNDDACVASCYDWYGDARPIFIGDRVYGLLGYELVEGRFQDGRIRETRRVDFRPAPAKAAPKKAAAKK